MAPLLGFCGASGSGKTTLVERVISELTSRGLRVGAIKHHGHAEPLPQPDAQKDSRRLARAGAARTALIHAGGVELTAGPQEAAQGPAQVAAAFMSGLDLVLVEGYKTADIPKIEVVAPGREPMLPAGGRLLALARRGGGPPEAGLQVLDADDPKVISDFVLQAVQADPSPRVSISVGGAPLELNHFVASFLENTLRGLTSVLKGGDQAGKIEVTIGPRS